jgi:hypothetical protein
MPWKTCIVYLDDIIVLSKTAEENLSPLNEVLRLYRAGLSMNMRKCHFLKETVSSLETVIHPGKLAVACKNTSALKTAKLPIAQSELRSFLGLRNVYRRFVPGLANIAAPLNKLFLKGESPQLGEISLEQKDTFEKLIQNLLDPPILALHEQRASLPSIRTPPITRSDSVSFRINLMEYKVVRVSYLVTVR